MLFSSVNSLCSKVPREAADIQGTETFLLQFHSDLSAQTQVSYRFACSQIKIIAPEQTSCLQSRANIQRDFCQSNVLPLVLE